MEESQAEHFLWMGFWILLPGEPEKSRNPVQFRVCLLENSFSHLVSFLEAEG